MTASNDRQFARQYMLGRSCSPTTSTYLASPISASVRMILHVTSVADSMSWHSIVARWGSLPNSNVKPGSMLGINGQTPGIALTSQPAFANDSHSNRPKAIGSDPSAEITIFPAAYPTAADSRSICSRVSVRRVACLNISSWLIACRASAFAASARSVASLIFAAVKTFSAAAAWSDFNQAMKASTAAAIPAGTAAKGAVAPATAAAIPHAAAPMFSWAVAENFLINPPHLCRRHSAGNVNRASR